MYPSSLIFSVPSSAFVGLACGNLFIGVITTISSFVLQLFDDAVLSYLICYLRSKEFNVFFSLQQLKLIGSILNEVYLIFPHYCLGRGMIDMAQVHFTTVRLELLGMFNQMLMKLLVIGNFSAKGYDYQRNIFEWDYLGRYFVSMIIQAIVFFSFTVMLHYQVLPERVVRFFQVKLKITPINSNTYYFFHYIRKHNYRLFSAKMRMSPANVSVLSKMKNQLMSYA